MTEKKKPWQDEELSYHERIKKLLQQHEQPEDGWGVSEIAEKTNIQKSRINKALKYFLKMGFLQQPEGPRTPYYYTPDKIKKTTPAYTKPLPKKETFKLPTTQKELHDIILKTGKRKIGNRTTRSINVPKTWFLLQVLTRDSEEIPGTNKQGTHVSKIIKALQMKPALALRGGRTRKTVEGQAHKIVRLIRDNMQLEKHEAYWTVPEQIRELILQDANCPLSYHKSSKTRTFNFMRNRESRAIARALLNLSEINPNKAYNLKTITKESKKEFQDEINEETIRDRLIRATGFVQYLGKDHWKVTPDGHKELKKRIRPHKL